MKIKELLTELKTRDSYKDFIQKYPKAYLCAGFFILGNDGDKLQLDYFIKDQQKITSFEYPFNTFILYKDKVESSNELDNLNLKVDLDNLKKTVKEKIGKDYPKIIAILKDNEWNITCLNGLEMQRLKIDAYTSEMTEKKKGLLTDFIKIQPKKE